MNTVNELVDIAMDLSPLGKKLMGEAEYEAERFEKLQAELMDPIYLKDVETDLDMREVITNTEVSQSVMQECLQEMQFAAKRGWKVPRKQGLGEVLTCQ